MGCPAEDALVGLVEGSLAGDAKAGVLAHLDACGSCRLAVAALAQSRSLAAPSGPLPSEAGPGDAAPADEIARGTLLGRYVILHRIGAGGMGVVYAAYDPVLDRKVALKLLRLDWAARRPAHPDDGRARLVREGQVMARLSHPHVIAVLDVGTWGERDFVAMELIDGATLGAWLRDETRAWPDALEVVIAAGQGLAAAHAAGLVHRDFKPDNVLVSRSGRVVVTDFGLARASGDGPAADPALRPDPVSPAETRSGALVGTPAYMAPEQLAGAAADARSDQFSYCATCFEALYGVRPFSAPTVIGLLQTIRAGQIARGERPVPAALRRIIVRGLAADPAARYPSMAVLLTELARLRHRRRRQFTVGAALIGTALVVGGVVQAMRRPAQLCAGAAQKWNGVWDGPRKAALRGVFAATGVPYADDAWRGVERLVDGYRDAWVAMHTDTCEATRVRGEQSESLLELRMACLDDGLRATRALGELFAAADAPLVQRAVTAAAHLPEISRCADEKVLRAQVPPPADAATRARVSGLGERRARVEALDHAGRYRDALALARPLTAEARALGYRPLEAELLDLQGDIEERSAEYPAAESTLHQALLAAEAGGHVEAEARAQVQLIALYGDRLSRFPDAHAAADHARALVERLGGDPRIAASLDDNLGLTLIEESKYSDARVTLERALALREKLAPDHPDTGITLNSLGRLLRQQGDYAGALVYHQRALALFEKALGPSHPHVAQATKSVGNAYWSKGQLDEALAHYQKALAIQERALGPDHPETAATRINIAAVYTQQGKLDLALDLYRRALAANEKTLGPDSAELLSSLNNIGVTLQAKGDLPGAEASLRRALAIAEKLYGPVHPEVETALVNLGDVLMSEHHVDVGLASYRRAVAISEKVVGPNHPHTAEDLGGLGFALLASKRPTEALAPLERAAAIGEKVQVDPVNLAKIRFALTRALWEGRGDRTRAVALARTARAVLDGSGGRQAPDVKEIDDWLRAHGVAAR